ARAVRAARHARGDHGLTERLERARHVHALSAGHRGLLDGPVAAAEPEVGDRERLVYRGVEGDRDDHLAELARCLRTTRRRSATSVQARTPRSAASTTSTPRSTEEMRLRRVGPGTFDSVTSGTLPATAPPARTSTRPALAPAGSGPSSRSGARTRTRTAVPRRTVSENERAGASCAWPL